MKKEILMCCSDLSVQGGMVSVIKNYLDFSNWGEYEIVFIPTHIEKNKILVSLYFAHAYIRIIMAVLTKKIKIAHLHTAERGSFYRKAILVRTLKKMGLKTIMHHHAAEFEQFYAASSDKKRKFIQNTLELTDLNIVLSERLVPMIKDKASKAKVEVLYNAVGTYDTNPYNPQGRGIIFLGRLGQRKGAYDLLASIKAIDPYIDSDIRFYLCGDGEIDKIKDKANEMAIEHRIAYIGWIEKEDKNRIFKDTMINVLPSYNEGLPMSILETMAYGIPNISTNIASIPEVIQPSVNGELITPGDIDALSNTLLKLINSVEIRKKYSLNSYNLITHKFSLASHIEKVKQIYLNI